MSQHKILMISLGILSWLFLLLLPLPFFLIDFVLSLQLAFSFIFLLFTLSPHIHQSIILKLPQALILLTLLRLSLNLATTRSILVNGQAGSLIDGISTQVLGDEWLIGLLLFGILSVIQLIVISQGAERMAQVLARFHLDALPQAHNQIQQALQLQALSFQAGQWQRQKLQEKMDLSASLDGVMKWVKGDAIANLLLLSINIIGGILVGTLRDQLSADEAALIYLKLSVGDAFLAQMPAMLTSIGISIYISHIDQSADVDLKSKPLGQQLFYPCQVTALIIALIAFLPGIDFLPLASASALLFGMGLAFKRDLILSEQQHYRIVFSKEAYIAVQAHIDQLCQSLEKQAHIKLSMSINQRLMANHYQIIQWTNDAWLIIFRSQMKALWQKYIRLEQSLTPKAETTEGLVILFQDRLYDQCFSIQKPTVQGSLQGILSINQLSGTWQEAGEYTAIQYLKAQMQVVCRPIEALTVYLNRLYALQHPLKHELIPKKMTELQLAYFLQSLDREGFRLEIDEALLSALCFCPHLNPKIDELTLIEQGRIAIRDLLCLSELKRFDMNQLELIQIHPELVEQAVLGHWGEEEWDIFKIELTPLLRQSPYAVLLISEAVTQSIPHARFVLSQVIHTKKPELRIFSNQELSAKVQIKQIGTIGF